MYIPHALISLSCNTISHPPLHNIGFSKNNSSLSHNEYDVPQKGTLQIYS